MTSSKPATSPAPKARRPAKAPDFAVSRRSNRQGTARPGDGQGSAYRCDVAAQAVLVGNQDIRVTAVAACASGTGHGHIAVRVGRVLIYLHDRESLNACRDAWGRAAEVADHAFGPIWRSQAAEAAARARRDGGSPIF
jgi:hypothetical protein